MKRVNYVIANWKMNGLRSHRKLYNSINKHLVSKKSNKPNVIICPPHTLIHTLALEKKSQVKLGAPNLTCDFFSNASVCINVWGGQIITLGLLDFFETRCLLIELYNFRCDLSPFIFQLAIT